MLMTKGKKRTYRRRKRIRTIGETLWKGHRYHFPPSIKRKGIETKGVEEKKEEGRAKLEGRGKKKPSRKRKGKSAQEVAF